MKIIYVTCCENGLYGLNYLVSKGYNISEVITITQEVAEKNKVSGYVDVTEFCTKLNMNLTKIDNYNIKPEDIKTDKPDLIIVNGWNRLIKSEVISMFTNGGLGIHAGHPPIGLGRAPLPWNIIKGFRDIEVYVFRLTERADDGDIVAKQAVEITPYDDIQTLYEKVMYQGACLFEQAILKFKSNTNNFLKQNINYAIYYEKRSADDGLINFSDSVESIHNFIRAQSRPYPGAYAYIGEKRWNIWKAIPFDNHAFRGVNRIPGEIILALPSGIIVQTGSSPLWIISADCNGSKVIPSDLSFMEKFVGKVFNERVGRLYSN